VALMCLFICTHLILNRNLTETLLQVPSVLAAHPSNVRLLKTDQLASVYGLDERQVRGRLAFEKEARQYIYNEPPEKYHSCLMPDFPSGCKRCIYEPGHLASLHRDNIDLVPKGIKEVTETRIISNPRREEGFDAIILALASMLPRS
jgi:hypothetical protein